MGGLASDRLIETASPMRKQLLGVGGDHRDDIDEEIAAARQSLRQRIRRVSLADDFAASVALQVGQSLGV